MPRPRTGEGRPLWGRAVYTALHGARLSSMPSGDQSANPASVPGRSGLQRAFLSVSSAQKCSGAGRDWLGHSKTLMCLFMSHSFVALAMCFGSLSCWNTHQRPIFNALAGCGGVVLSS